MKILEKEFVSNVDHCGSHKFVQMKREGDVAVYCRYQSDNAIFGYEVFRIKVVKEGSPLPGGAIVKEDYEVYPSKNSFGKTALYFATCEALNVDKLITSFNERFNKEADNDVIKDTSEFVIPGSEFTVKMLMSVNPKKNYNDCYLYLKENLNKTITQVDKSVKPKGKGKPSNYYIKL